MNWIFTIQGKKEKNGRSSDSYVCVYGVAKCRHGDVMGWLQLVGSLKL